MIEARKQVFGVIDALPDPHASIIENYVLQIEAENARLKRQTERPPTAQESERGAMDNE